MSNGRLFFTGDTHGSLELDRLSFKNFPEGKNLTKNDYLCILGDSGIVWDESKEGVYWRDWLEDRPFTVISVLGNHCNYDLINQLPRQEWNGGFARMVQPHVMYLENGYVFNLNGFKSFVMGGATSRDKQFRKEHISWWKEEIPSYAEMNRGIDNLSANNYTVDLILSHCAPDSIVKKLFYSSYSEPYDKDVLTTYLEEQVRQQVNFKRHFFGHYHTDRCLEDGKFMCLYHDFEEILQDFTTKTYEIPD